MVYFNDNVHDYILASKIYKIDLDLVFWNDKNTLNTIKNYMEVHEYFRYCEENNLSYEHDEGKLELINQITMNNNEYYDLNTSNVTIQNNNVNDVDDSNVVDDFKENIDETNNLITNDNDNENENNISDPRISSLGIDSNRNNDNVKKKSNKNNNQNDMKTSLIMNDFTQW